MSVTAATTQQLYWQDPAIAADLRAGVSIHSHTTCSEETMSVVPPVIAKLICLRSDFLRRTSKQKPLLQVKPNFGHGFWTPPLPPRQAYRLEEKQIHSVFDLPAIVSLTDHDNVRASSLLRVIRRFRHAPISTEWSIPFGTTFFHLGIHNLDPQTAESWMADLNAYSAAPNEARLVELLRGLNDNPDLLVVANHPLWDEKGIGQKHHEETLRRLLSQAGPYIHALEANGLRSLEENNRVREWGARCNLPVVAGGDRHGLEPNAILNLSRGTTLTEFIHEVRYRRWSHMIYMPQFQQSRFLRILHMVTDVVRDYPDNFEGRRTFADRIFYRTPDSNIPVSFSSVYGEHSLSPIKPFLAAMQVVGPASTLCYSHECMSGVVLDGKKIRDEILEELRPRVEALKAKGTSPVLAVVLVGDDPASHIYVRNKLKASEELGIGSIEIRVSGHLSTAELTRHLEGLSKELQGAHAILVQMPLPSQIDAEAITTRFVDGTRDVDGFGAFSLGQLVLNRPWPRACTPAGIMEMLKRYEIPIAGRKAVVVGRSDIVGKPMSLLLLHQNATVTVCHSKTHDLAAECRTADILVAAIGRPAFLTADHIKPGAVVVDVGMNRVTDRGLAEKLFRHQPKRLESFEKTGSVLVGDVDPQAMEELSSAYTPVPGGVGPLTIAMLMANTVTLAEHASAS